MFTKAYSCPGFCLHTASGDFCNFTGAVDVGSDCPASIDGEGLCSSSMSDTELLCQLPPNGGVQRHWVAKACVGCSEPNDQVLCH